LTSGLGLNANQSGLFLYSKSYFVIIGFDFSA
jgi:hypothetical protein